MGNEFDGTSVDRMRIGDGLQAAIERARRMMFEPFNFERWLLFGIIAFLDVFLAGGGATRFGSNFSSQGGGQSSLSGSDFDQAAEWIGQNIGFLVSVAAIAIIIGLAIHVGLLYIGCRGQIMLVRSVALDGGKMGDHWGAVKRPATSLFFFRLVLLGAQLAVVLVTLVFAVIAIAAQGGIQSGEALLFTVIPFAVLFLLVAICMGLVHLMLRSFVVPLMWAQDLTCLEAWSVFGSIARANVLPLIGFVVVKIGYGVCFAIATFFVGCFTCCIGGLPVVHHTIFAPYYVFDRAFSMELLSMTGDAGNGMFPADHRTDYDELPRLQT